MSKIYIGKKIASSINGAGKHEFQCGVNEARSLYLHLYKTQWQMDQRSQHKTWYAKNAGVKGRNILD